ncbi:hypothetical protein KEM54_002149 [Ascosphaera aggregata]|nr:hypothetical protein KEM54_002149 [Ascosphaera aggregata]
MAPKKEEAAVSFEEIICKARERRKNQEFTTEFFKQTRQKKKNQSQGRSGLSKNRSSLENRISLSSAAATSAATGKLQHRIHKPGTPSAAAAAAAASPVNGNLTTTFIPKGPLPRGPRHGNRRAAQRSQHQRVAAAAALTAAIPPSSSASSAAAPDTLNMHAQVPQTMPQHTQTTNFSIRGAASGPCTVVGSNFAPGTTAADIQSAFEPVGGPILSCVLVNTHPMVVAEVVFPERAGAESVIAKFNNQKVSGKFS